MEAKFYGNLKVVTEHTALTLLHAKSKGKIDVNIKSPVKSVSEIFRIKQTQIFLIQLLEGLNIFVKKKEFLKWHDEIYPQRCYIFTNLQPTSLEKGCKRHHQFYTVTKNSKVLCDQDLEKADILNVQEWLQHCGLDEETVQLACGDENDDGDDQHTVTDPKLVSYQGVVTKVLDEALGVYELDNRVRLYVSVVPAVHKYGFMQEGLSVTLYNVHCNISREVPKVRLYCCMFSVVKVDHGSPGCRTRRHFPDAQLQKVLYLQGVTIPQLDWLYTTRNVLFHNMNTVCQKRDAEKIISVLLSSLKLPWQQESSDYRNFLDEFLPPGHACCLSLKKKSSAEALPSYRTVSELKHDVETGEAFRANQGEYWQFEKKDFNNHQILFGVLGTSTESGRPILYDNTGHISAVIAGCHGDDLSHLCQDSCCCDTQKRGSNFSCAYVQPCCVGKIVGIYRYTVAMETFVTNGNQPQGGSTSSAGVKSHKVLYIEFSMSDAVILGNTIQGNKHFGGPENKAKPNKVSEKPGCLKGKAGINIPTEPVEGAKVQSEVEDVTPDTNSIAGNRILCDRTSLRHSGGNSYTSLKSNSILHRHTNREGGSYFCRNENCLVDNIDENSIKPVMNVKPVSQKRKLPGDDHKTKGKVLCVNTSETAGENSEKPFGNEICDETDDDNKILNSASKEMRRPVAAIGVENGSLADNVVNVKPQYSMVSSESQCLVKVNNRESLVLEACAKDSISLMCSIQGRIWKNGKFESEMVITFKGKSVRWYPLLWPNSLYMFSIPQEFTPLLKSALSNSKVEQVIERSKAKRCLLVHPEVSIHKVLDAVSDSGDEVAKLSTISDIMETSAGLGKFVSFKGQITHRSHSDPETVKGRMQKSYHHFSSVSGWSSLQISTPENRCVRLQVKDLESASEITVFMNLENTVYPLGLLPGAVILFTRLERKVSRMGNIYTRFVATSSLHLIAVSSSEVKLKQDKCETSIDHTTESGKEKTFPKQKLIDVWQSKTAFSDFQCVCDVLQIIKLSVKCVCSLCRGTVVGSQCHSVGCHMENGTKFLARASFIVDDGTSVAIVTQTGSTVMRLLGLSHDQWVCIEEETRQHGEVFIQQTRPAYGTPLEKFVYMLCDNRTVKKTWLMTLKTNQYNRLAGKSGMDLDSLTLDEFQKCLIRVLCPPFDQATVLSLAMATNLYQSLTQYISKEERTISVTIISHSLNKKPRGRQYLGQNDYNKHTFVAKCYMDVCTISLNLALEWPRLAFGFPTI